MREVLRHHLTELGFVADLSDFSKPSTAEFFKDVNADFKLRTKRESGEHYLLNLLPIGTVLYRRDLVTWYEFTDDGVWHSLGCGIKQLTEVAECLSAKNPRCPRCKAIMLDRVMEKDGHPHKGEAFWSCVHYPECKGMVAHWKDVDLEDGAVLENVRCPKCSRVMVARRARQGKYAGELFYGCSGYPECKGLLSEGEAVAAALKKL